MKILIVEDDKILSDTIRQCIIRDYEVQQVEDGYEAYCYAKKDIYDAILLDLMIPEMSGYDVILKLREERIDTPIIVLTAKDDTKDKVKALKYGADDYITKPFEREELLARIEALIRRSTGNYKESILKFKELNLNLKSRKVKIKDNELNLQGKQFDLLEYLIQSVDAILTKEQLFDKIWGLGSDTSINVVEVYASGLRKELKKHGYDKYLKTIRNVGYMLENK